MNRQEQLFNEIKTAGYNVVNLAGFVQNDFDQMLQEGDVSIYQLKESLTDITLSFDAQIAELERLKYRTLNIVEEKIDEHS